MLGKTSEIISILKEIYLQMEGVKVKIGKNRIEDLLVVKAKNSNIVIHDGLTVRKGMHF